MHDGFSNVGDGDVARESECASTLFLHTDSYLGRHRGLMQEYILAANDRKYDFQVRQKMAANSLKRGGAPYQEPGVRSVFRIRPGFAEDM